MAEEQPKLGFGSYRLGTSYGIKQGITPPIGLNQAINWGAPQVELGEQAGNIGRTGRRVIKELAEANEIDLTWHVPVDQSFELALPDKRTNSEAVRKLNTALDFVKDVDAKLINIHPTQVINRPDPDTIYVYDNHAQQATTIKIPDRILREAKEKGGNPVKMIIEEQNKLKTSQFRDSIKDREYWGNHYNSQAEKLKPFAESLPVAKKYWSKLSDEGKRAIAASTSLITDKAKPDEITQEVVDKIVNDYELFKGQSQASADYANMLKKEYQDFLGLNGREAKPFLIEGEEKMKENFVENFAPIAKKAIESGVQIGIENTDNRFIFGTPEDINDIINKLGKKLETMGISKSQITKNLGTTFDMGHAASIKGMQVRNKETGELTTIKTPPEEMLKKFKNVIHVHASENFGDMDAHLPIGEAFTDKQREEMTKYLEESGFKGRILHEVGELGGLSYAISLEKLSPGMYEVGGVPTVSMFGPSYQMTDPTEGLFFPGEKRENYFYGTWLGGHI